MKTAQQKMINTIKNEQVNMILKVHSIVSYHIILFGLIHICFVYCLDNFDTYALWFTGAGIAILFAGFINLIRTKSDETIVFSICVLTNSIITLLFMNALFAMQKPQVYVGIVVFAVAFILSLKKYAVINKKKTKKYDCANK